MAREKFEEFKQRALANPDVRKAYVAATIRNNPCKKRRYRTDVDAKIALARLERQDKVGHTERRAYRCPNCKGWHLTSRADA